MSNILLITAQLRGLLDSTLLPIGFFSGSDFVDPNNQS